MAREAPLIVTLNGKPPIANNGHRPPLPPRWLLFWRGVTKRCPYCGERRIFRRWFTLVERCPRCNLLFEREEGYWTGSIAINTVVTEFVFAVVLAIWVALTVPSVPIAPLLITGVAMNATFPLAFHPFSKTLWLALDLAFHPIEPQEVATLFGKPFG
ncbi:DUF983 domain-containing protein [Thermorudis peleae]|uniref:DUF983 domain-containing protein n=1 Tax=Thermorudis peleae TaxID=1382356 RepID=UPI0006899B87|nr:DUF983 domain-containing protein [Thermorudis peleae]